MTDDRRPGDMPPPPPPPPPGGQGSRPSGSTPSGTSSGWSEPAAPASADWQSPQHAGGPQPAGLGPRIGAYLIDSIGIGLVIGIPIIILMGIFVMATDTGGGGFGFGYLPGVIVSLGVLAYFALMESRDGQTLAKKMLSIKVIDAQGGVPTLQQAALRRLPFVIGSFIPVIGGLVTFALVIAILVTAAQDKPWNRGLHDRWAETTVVRA